ncbi:MAG: hypothetical protein LBQ66_15720 [Planctomycetaceae bacterium]|jgi:hypothetical protein|nr:hypothetical protein [Planctomycetaceae bacterium]
MKKTFFVSLLFLFTAVFSVFAEEAKSPPVKEIILVFKTHFDIGFTKLASEVVETYRTGMIDNALNVVDTSQDLPEEKKFVWTVPGWPMSKILENQTPERAARLEKALRSGRFAVHALPFTTHTETLVEEDFVRSLRFADNVNRKFGKELSTDAKMTDVPCHSWFLPTLLAHSGITFMHEGTNSGCYDPEVPMLYFREGPDGSRVLTMHVNGYGTGIDPPKNWRYQTWLGLIHTGDNHGPPRADEVEKLFRQCTAKYPNVKVRIGRLADFGNAILEKENLAEIPVVKGDMPDTWIHGPMCDPQGQKIARRVHEQLASTELLGTLYKIATGKREIFPTPQTLDVAYEQSLLYGEHTWGASLSWMCNLGRGETLPFGDVWKKIWESQNFNASQKRVIASWDEHSNYIKKADELLNASGNANSAETFGYFNPLTWDIVTYQGDKLAPGQICKIKKPNPPANPQPVTEKEAVAESPFFRLTVNTETGKISLFDKKNRRDVFKETSPHFLYQRASYAMCDKFLKDYTIIKPNWVVTEIGKQGVPKDVPEQRFVVKEIEKCSIVKNADSQIVNIQYKQQEALPFSGFSLSIELSEHRPVARFAFDGKAKQPDTWPEAGYFYFPLDIESPQFRLGRLGGIVDPAKDIIRGSNRHFAWLRTGLAVFGGDGFGVGICPLDSPLVSLGEVGGWMFSRDYVPDKADVYFNLFNNQWTTNFRLWNQGDISASFVLWTFDKYDNETSLITPSLETLALNDPPNGVLLEAASKFDINGIRLNRKGINITSFGEETNSKKLMLRLWEMAGLGKDNPTVEVQLPTKLNVKNVTPCDLRNRPIAAPIPVSEGRFQIDIKPYSPVNLLVE